MDLQRPESDTHSRPAHQRTKTSVSETSTTRSRGRGHGSKPSSRRTSCTFVDPGRSRHHRIQSSNTVPTVTSQDIDDVYALHHRSYSLFQNPSLHSRSGLPSPTSPPADQYRFPSSGGRASIEEPFLSNAHKLLLHQAEDTEIVTERPATTMHWTSPCTRRKEYDRIDRANSGVRGFLHKVVPRCVSGPQEKFYTKDQSDAGSVRRYRMDDEASEEEKDLTRSHTLSMRKSSTANKWTCF
ncbi:hypothetical protein ACEQ8H_001066 [Pleosporales sp. CAS-2024a]